MTTFHGPSSHAVVDHRLLMFQRQSTKPGAFSRAHDLSWLDDPRLLVRNPRRPHLLGPKARIFALLCVLAMVTGALVAVGV